MSDPYDRQAEELIGEWSSGWHEPEHPICGPPLTDLAARVAVLLRTAAATARAEEREGCAQLADQQARRQIDKKRPSGVDDWACAQIQSLAALIRARGEGE